MSKLTELWLCFTYNRKGKFRPITIRRTLKEAKAWAHERVDKIIQMEKLRANYELRIGCKRVSQKYYSAWRKFARENNLNEITEEDLRKVFSGDVDWLGSSDDRELYLQQILTALDKYPKLDEYNKILLNEKYQLKAEIEELKRKIKNHIEVRAGETVYAVWRRELMEMIE